MQIPISEQLHNALKSFKPATLEDNPRLKKAIGIAEVVAGYADHFSISINNLASYTKKRPRFLRRKKFSKKEVIKRRMILMLHLEMSRMQIHQIASTPIPKNLSQGAPAIIKERNEEFIVRFNPLS